MKTIYSKKYSLHNSLTELSGGKLVKPFETSARVKFILNEISNRKLGPIIDAKDQDLDIIYKVHYKNYVKFLETAWDEWIKEGFKGEAIPTVWPSRSMNSKIIPNQKIAHLFKEFLSVLKKHDLNIQTDLSQIYRNNSMDLNCKRHKTIFNKFNIIPKFCFSCYKVQIEPRTILELIKLMVIFDRIKLDENNIRKCMIELRPDVFHSERVIGAPTYRVFI